MVPDYLCVPGLDRPVTVSEYAKLKGIREAEVLAAIHALKIPSAFSRGQWYVEAPPNCEERLAPLRGERRTPDSSDKTGTMKQPGLPLSELPRRDPINKDKHDGSEQLPARLKERPQPIDYGLTYDDLNLHGNVRAWQPEAEDDKWPKRFRTAEQVRASLQRRMGRWVMGTRGPRPDDVYKPGRRWFGFWRIIIPGLSNRLRQSPSPELQAYRQALDTHDKAKLAAEKAAHDAEMRKRSYWEFLDGYAFERATAEVLQRHQFNPRVTPGSADGGIDIEVTRGGLKGVVQCKAHVACVGPHVVRDLYGVIHHCGASFGIIVSRGGFSRGAIDFARDKPILFLDVSDLIAMKKAEMFSLQHSLARRLMLGREAARRY